MNAASHSRRGFALLAAGLVLAALLRVSVGPVATEEGTTLSLARPSADVLSLRATSVASAAAVGAALGLAEIALAAGDLPTAARYFAGAREQGAPTRETLCFGQRLAARTGDTDLAASQALALRSLYPNAADPCVEPARTQGP